MLERDDKASLEQIDRWILEQHVDCCDKHPHVLVEYVTEEEGQLKSRSFLDAAR